MVLIRPGVIMACLRIPFLLVLASLLFAGCATRPVNPPITQADPQAGYRFETRQAHIKDKDNLVILAFSGGGTRAAAFSYGVLEFLRRTEVVGPKGNKVRLLDEVDIITGVSGGSFTALAYGLYGDKLFDDYEQRFLKRDVQGEIISRTFSPANWGEAVVDGLGPLRAGGRAVRRDPVQRRHVRRSRPRQGPADPGVGHRHLDRLPLRLHPAHLRRHLLGSQRRAAVARRRGVVGRAGRALARHAQQLRRHLQQDHARLGEAVHRHRQSAATRRAGDPLAQGRGGLRRRRPIGRTSISSTAACRTTWACARVLDALEVLEALHEAGMPTPLDSAQQDHRLHRQFAVVAADQLGRVGGPARHRGHPAQVGRHADRRLFLRGGRTAEGHGGAVADACA